MNTQTKQNIGRKRRRMNMVKSEVCISMLELINLLTFRLSHVEFYNLCQHSHKLDTMSYILMYMLHSFFSFLKVFFHLHVHFKETHQTKLKPRGTNFDQDCSLSCILPHPLSFPYPYVQNPFIWA